MRPWRTRRRCIEVRVALPKVGDKSVEGDKGGGSKREGEKGEKREENLVAIG